MEELTRQMVKIISHVYVRMDALICTCEYTCKGQRWTSSALSYHFPSYSLEAGSCTELGVGLVSSSISILSLFLHQMALGLQALAHGHFWVYVNVGAGIQTLRLV